jgi:hypothetical protein
MSTQQQPPEFKQNVGKFIGLCQCLSFMGEVWWKQPGTVGNRRFSGQAFIGWGLLFIIAAFSGSHEMMTFWAATGAWFVMHKFAYTVRQRKGLPRHGPRA